MASSNLSSAEKSKLLAKAKAMAKREGKAGDKEFIKAQYAKLVARASAASAWSAHVTPVTEKKAKAKSKGPDLDFGGRGAPPKNFGGSGPPPKKGPLPPKIRPPRR